MYGFRPPLLVSERLVSVRRLLHHHPLQEAEPWVLCQLVELLQSIAPGGSLGSAMHPPALKIAWASDLHVNSTSVSANNIHGSSRALSTPPPKLKLNHRSMRSQ